MTGLARRSRARCPKDVDPASTSSARFGWPFGPPSTSPALANPVARAALHQLLVLAPAVGFALASVAGARPLAAGGLDFDLLGARSIGRAGTSTVSGDGGAALVINPAGLARSSSLRLQLGLALHDDDAGYRPPNAAAMDSPTVVDRSVPTLAPSVAVHGALGPVVLGAALLELGDLVRLFPAPPFGEVPENVARLYPHRYGGLELTYRRRLAVVGAAVRIGDWLGLGLSLGASDVELAERRHIWAGFAGRDQLAFPTRDLDLVLSARDGLVPFASAGILVAPPSLPIELAAAVSTSGDAFLDGEAVLSRTSDADYPAPQLPAGSPTVAAVRLGMPNTARAGLRYLGDRFQVEVGADLTWLRSAGKVPVWSVSGVSVLDETGLSAAVDQIPSLASQRNHATLRGAVDFELVPGLLWLTGGYAYAAAATERARISPGFGDTGGHTVSLGAEGTWNQITLAVGFARRLSRTVVVMASESDVLIENPFDAGTASAGAGTHERAHDAVGLTMEVAWE